MKSDAKQLARAILTRAKELHVSVGKTKFLKLLYLADIEHFRDANETLSGLNWIFYLYGPWSPDYDKLLEQLEAEGAISKKAFAAGGIEGEQLTVQDELDLSKVIQPAAEYFRTKHLIDTWLERATSQLLDFVYFETEPMIGAAKETPLDFSKVNKEPPVLYRRSRGTGTAEQRRDLRKRLTDLAKRFRDESAGKREKFDLAYGDDFAEALVILDADTAE